MSKWRLGIDLGTNSVGVVALSLGGPDGAETPTGLLDMGVRIFSDGRNPKDKQSLAAMRRGPRGMRRNRDRGLNRNARFLRELQAFGLLPKQSSPPTEDEIRERRALEEIDPYILRAKGLDEKLSRHELGRALYHLKRRGFQSNRKTDGGDEESGKIRDATRRTQELLKEAGSRTLGEWLGRARIERVAENEALPQGSRKPLPQTRTRLRGTGAKAYYDFYPTRAMILDEFDMLWTSQKRWHPDLLTDEAYTTLRETLSFQWPLKAQPVGKCVLDPSQPRAPRALPSVQRLRIYQDINHLAVQLPGEAGRPLTRDERDILAAKSLGQAKIEFEAMRKWLKLPWDARFNMESEKRKHLDGDLTAAKLAGKNFWGPEWRSLPFETQEEIVARLIEQEDENALTAWLIDRHGLTRERAVSVSRAGLPSGHGAFCTDVSRKLLAALESDVVTYDKAVMLAGYASHSEFGDGEIFERALPYYGKVLERHVAFGTGDPADPEEKRYGKIANPTVHVALNQLRRVVNDLIRRFGAPAQIVVELARDLPLSAQGQKELDRNQQDNQTANDARRAILAEQGQPDSYDNRMRLRLWEELNLNDPLDRRCVFTGEQISLARLFSADVEIEHLLPFSRTLDDGPANKTVSMRWANRIKGRQSPHEAFSHSPEGFDWAEITRRAGGMPVNKRWRFAPDAMERFENDERDFLARQLTDTQYIARIAASYLKRTGADVWVTPGRLTADLRWALGLDSALPGHNREETGNAAKNRLDHRHHAVDALVVALTDRSLLNRTATLAAQQEELHRSRLLPSMDEPWPGFREDMAGCLERLIVSHKPDHGVEGALHNDTAYGLVDEEAVAGEAREVVHRVPLDGFRKRADLERIRDPLLRNHFLSQTEGVPDKELGKALAQIGENLNPPVRRVRICERLNVIPIRDASGKPYKAYKGDANYCYDIFEGTKGKWTGQVVSRFNANRKGFRRDDRLSTEGEPLIMRLRVNDMLELEHSGKRRAMRVVKLSKGKISLAEHHEAGSLKSRDSDKGDPFEYLTVSPGSLQTRAAVLIQVSPSGAVRHRGNLS